MSDFISLFELLTQELATESSHADNPSSNPPPDMVFVDAPLTTFDLFDMPQYASDDEDGWSNRNADLGVGLTMNNEATDWQDMVHIQWD